MLFNSLRVVTISGMHSMTGFGRGSAATGQWHATVEISTVNRKQLEVVIQLPRELQELDGRIRKSLLGRVSRGRLQVSINLEAAGGGGQSLRVDVPLATAMRDALVELEKTVGHPLSVAAADYLRQPGMLVSGTREVDCEEAWLAVGPALDDALAALNAMRETEGGHLRQDALQRLAALSDFANRIAALASLRPARQRELLTKRLSDAGLELDVSDERVTREIALFADRCDVSEELTRLDSHFAKFREYLDASEPPGRALDFLCQELFREFNTIGSKANDAVIAQTIVEAKTELEKIREQVQNIE